MKPCGAFPGTICVVWGPNNLIIYEEISWEQEYRTISSPIVSQNLGGGIQGPWSEVNPRVHGSLPHCWPDFCRSCMTTLPTDMRFWTWLAKGPSDRWSNAWITKTMSWWPWKLSGIKRGMVWQVTCRHWTMWLWLLPRANSLLHCSSHISLWLLLFLSLPLWYHKGARRSKNGVLDAFWHLRHFWGR